MNAKSASNRRSGSPLPLVIMTILLVLPSRSTQSIGYQPNLNLGFNPYFSPTFGYGLGLPYGANGLAPFRSPWLTGYGLGSGGSLISKIHAKTIAKKLEPALIGLNSMHAGIKEKIALKKHSHYSMIPESFDYGYGQHYGSAQIPNNPYKSAYADYYHESGNNHDLRYPTTAIMPGEYPYYVKPYHVIKPIIKVGALLTTAALLNKKLIAMPQALDPSGMIINSS